MVEPKPKKRNERERAKQTKYKNSEFVNEICIHIHRLISQYDPNGPLYFYSLLFFLLVVVAQSAQNNNGTIIGIVYEVQYIYVNDNDNNNNGKKGKTENMHQMNMVKT